MSAASTGEPLGSALHPALAGLAPLIGEWSGSGHGSYPTVESFDYRETLHFLAAGDRPFLLYSQRTWDARDGRPLHVETGYLRPSGSARAELVVAQPTGIVEIDEGTVDFADSGALELVLRARPVAVSSTAKLVTDVERFLHAEGGVLRTRLAMAAVGHPLTHHLASELRPAPPSGDV